MWLSAGDPIAAKEIQREPILEYWARLDFKWKQAKAAEAQLKKVAGRSR